MGTIRNLVTETSIPRHRNLIEALFGMKCENSEETNGRKYNFFNITIVWFLREYSSPRGFVVNNFLHRQKFKFYVFTSLMHIKLLYMVYDHF